MIMKLEEVPLTPEQQQNLEKWEKDWGKESAEQRANYLRRENYKEMFLLREVTKPASKPFRCYTEGQNKFCRKDGKPLTEEDIRVIADTASGNMDVRVKGKAGDLSVLQDWAIDSS